MTPIKLTQEQKDKLLEMCKALFPEYTYYCFSNQQGNIYDNNAEFVMFSGNLGGIAVKVHWFEFCMTHLQIKLQLRLNNWIDKWNHDLIGVVFAYLFHGNQRIHLVDYLYEQFLKLETT